MVGMQPLVSATINGHDVQFVADSGAFFSDLTPGNAAELKLPLRARAAWFLHHRHRRRQRAVDRDGQIARARRRRHTARPVLGRRQRGRRVGLLGQNVLGIADVEYDLEDGMIRLMKADGLRRQSRLLVQGQAGLDDRHRAALETLSHHRVGPPQRQQDPGRLRYRRRLVDPVASAAARLGIRPTSPGVKPAGSTRGLGRHIVQTWIAPIDSLKIGDEEIRHFKMRIGDIGIDDATC